MTVVGAVASSLWMGLGTAAADLPAAGDTSRFYFGTDSHAMGLLTGAAGFAGLALATASTVTSSVSGCPTASSLTAVMLPPGDVPPPATHRPRTPPTHHRAR